MSVNDLNELELMELLLFVVAFGKHCLLDELSFVALEVRIQTPLISELWFLLDTTTVALNQLFPGTAGGGTRTKK